MNDSRSRKMIAVVERFSFKRDYSSGKYLPARPKILALSTERVPREPGKGWGLQLSRVAALIDSKRICKQINKGDGLCSNSGFGTFSESSLVQTLEGFYTILVKLEGVFAFEQRNVFERFLEFG